MENKTKEKPKYKGKVTGLAGVLGGFTLGVINGSCQANGNPIQADLLTSELGHLSLISSAHGSYKFCQSEAENRNEKYGPATKVLATAAGPLACTVAYILGIYAGNLGTKWMQGN